VTYEEFPVYVEMGTDRLCSIVCSPAMLDKDLGVVLLTGGNYTRSHRNRMWTHGARRLAAEGWPSIRFDYHGSGDSTGAAEFDLEEPFDDDVLAAADFLRQATGVTRVALVATCFGGRSALAAAARSREVCGTTLFPTPLLVPGTGRPPRFRSRVKASVKKYEWGQQLLQRPTARRLRNKGSHTGAEDRGESISPRFKKDLARFLEWGSVRFVYGEQTPHLAELRRCWSEIDPHLTTGERERLTLDLVPGTDLQRFQSLEDQAIVVAKTIASVEHLWASLVVSDERSSTSVTI
jgi:pimeloyl-ACP methyl ester carboxylesterase